MTVSDLASHRFLKDLKTAQASELYGVQILLIGGRTFEIRGSMLKDDTLTEAEAVQLMAEALRGGAE